MFRILLRIVRGIRVNRKLTATQQVAAAALFAVMIGLFGLSVVDLKPKPPSETIWQCVVYRDDHTRLFAELDIHQQSGVEVAIPGCLQQEKIPNPEYLKWVSEHHAVEPTTN